LEEIMETGAQRLIRTLEEMGIGTVFGIPGGAALPLYDALYNSSLRHVLARHEQGAAFMAQGMARVTGRSAVCLATSGPGATNLLTALADAERDSVPLVAITAQVERARIGTRAFQEVDIVSMARACLKDAWQAESADELGELLQRALACAASPCPGPVLLDIPKDLLLAPCRSAFAGVDVRNCPEQTPTDPDAMAAARSLLHRSCRPIVVAGAGAATPQGARALARLAEAGIPSTFTLRGLGGLPSKHPMNLGMFGMHGHPVANLALGRADLLIVAGARLDERAVSDPESFGARARILRIERDQETADAFRGDCRLVGDAAELLEQLASGLEGAERYEWKGEIEALSREFPLPLREGHGIVVAVAAAVGDDALFATDVGQHQMWTAQSLPLSRPGQFLTSGGFGTMGFGLPAAIGASLAAPLRKVVCFSGDGSLLMNLQELASLAELGLPVKICLFDNGGLGLVRQQQDLFLGRRRSGCDYEGTIDFSAIAMGFGIPALSLEAGEWWESSSWQALLKADGPALVSFRMSPEDTVSPHVPGGRALSEMLWPEVDSWTRGCCEEMI
jgi:acetolactate synthase-1/2/3 large subunit